MHRTRRQRVKRLFWIVSSEGKVNEIGMMCEHWGMALGSRSGSHDAGYFVAHTRRISAAACLKSGQSNRERNWWTSNIERPTSNVEWMYSVYFKTDFAKRFHPSKFDIRYSAVRCLIRVIQATRLIIKKPYHFGVVSYEGLKVPFSSLDYIWDAHLR